MSACRGRRAGRGNSASSTTRTAPESASDTNRLEVHRGAPRDATAGGSGRVLYAALARELERVLHATVFGAQLPRREGRRLQRLPTSESVSDCPLARKPEPTPLFPDQADCYHFRAFDPVFRSENRASLVTFAALPPHAVAYPAPAGTHRTHQVYGLHAQARRRRCRCHQLHTGMSATDATRL